ncbi:hypothetical protein F5X97DRAFT_298454 [Nemania serpens]|nr:hypothetical protein F5X97DRAFT_298454 [Nemania serpens]
MAPLSSTTSPAEEYTRLHITPFDLSLQNVVIPASVLPRARNISFHTIETFPENRFGFVDLPTMDADKLKNKLNGAVLKGTKLRVETAHPESKPGPTGDTSTSEVKKKKKKSKKRKHETGVLEGVQLEGRKVKRGWTTTEQEMIEEKRKKARKEKKDEKVSRDEKASKDEKKDKKDKKKKKATVKSKYTDDPECLFKTRLPEASPSKGPSKEHEEAGEEDSIHKKKRKRKSDREVVVHEFEKTTKYPTFLKSSATETTSAEATTFEDGVGWVDSKGNVVEPAKSRRRPEGIPAPAPAPPKSKEVVPPPQEGDDDETSSSGSSSSDEDEATSSSGSESDVPDKQTKPIAPSRQQLKVEIAVLNNSPGIAKPESARPKSSSSVTSLSIKIPPTTPAAKKIHPLEALYKRPQGDHGTANNGPNSQPFSFFGNGDDIEEDDHSMAPTSQAPMTPFTKQEFEFRNVRSAAPTPDTAHPSRSFNFWASQDSTVNAGADEEDETHELAAVAEQEQEDEEDVDMEDGVAGGQTSPTPASDFQKQFWESRGDLNRAWRKRRKSAAKEKRYRDNRARAERAI